MRVLWTPRRSNQSILKGINPEYSLEGLMLKLKLQYFGHLIQRTDSLEKTLILVKIESKRRTGLWRMKWLDSITNSVQFSSVTQSCPTLCDSMNRSTPGLPVHHQLPESTQTMSIVSVMPSNHLILCRPLLLLPSIFPSIRVFSNESTLCIRLPKY